MRGVKLRTFKYDDYDVPDYPSVVLIAKADAVNKRADVLQRFLDATRRGFEYAAANPDAAAREFIDYMPDGTFENPDLIGRSTKMLAPIYLGTDRRWGKQDGAQWDAYAHWLIGEGVVTDGNGKPVKDVTGRLFTNDLISGSQ
jgi:ABC-type nitrate/sulfonate/bicarbonate transport system substrate-binding protein